MQTGWLQEGSTWYYLKLSGAMAISWEKVNEHGITLMDQKMQTGWYGSTRYL